MVFVKSLLLKYSYCPPLTGLPVPGLIAVINKFTDFIGRKLNNNLLIQRSTLIDIEFIKLEVVRAFDVGYFNLNLVTLVNRNFLKRKLRFRLPINKFHK